jgi:hypothetical protein
MGFFLLVVVFPRKIAFSPEDLPVLVESPGAWRYRHFGNRREKIQYPTPGVSPQRSVDPAGRGAAATSLTVRHGVPMTVGRAPVFCHAVAISLS